MKKRDEVIGRIADDIPGLSEREREIIYRLVGITMVLHLDIFPNIPDIKKSPIFAIDLEESGEIPEGNLMAYAEKEDCYAIFPYHPVKKIRRLKEYSFFRIWEDGIIREFLKASFEALANKKDWGGLLFEIFKSKDKEIHRFTLNEVLVGLAAHEVRHRLQKHLLFPIGLFSTEKILNLRINSYEDYKLRVLAATVSGQIVEGGEGSALSENKKKEEFDAALIGHLAIKKWESLKKLEEISKISRLVKTGFAEFIEMKGGKLDVKD